jgi:hypothetical protein
VSGSINSLFLTSAIDGSDWTNSCPSRFDPRKVNRLSIEYGAVVVAGSVWTL